MGGSNIREAKQEIVDWAENIGSTADFKQGYVTSEFGVANLEGLIVVLCS